MNIITSQRTYATVENAERALSKTLAKAGSRLEDVRYLIAVGSDGRFVPTLVGIQYCAFAHHGIMVIS